MAEDSDVKAHVIADYLEHNLRSAYESETHRAALKKNGGADEPEAASVGGAFGPFRKFQ